MWEVYSTSVCKSHCTNEECKHSITFVAHKPDEMTQCIMCKSPVKFVWTIYEEMEKII